MKIINFSDELSIVNQYIAEMRDVEIQKDPLRFRTNMERVGMMIGYEISKHLRYNKTQITTPLGVSNDNLLKDQLVLATILRAGLALNEGMMKVFDRSEAAFVTAYRKYHSNNEFDIKVEYLSSPSIQDKVLILSDPMLATGSSMCLSYEALLRKGTPSEVHIVSALSSKEGIEYVKRHIPNDNLFIWTGAIDDELTVQSYIVPGLGDAGDLAFGKKED